MRISDLKIPKTDYVKSDERCLGVLDVDLQTEDYKMVRRHRLTYVVRNDRPALYAQDLTTMGWYSPLELRRRPPAQVICTDPDETVAEIWDIIEWAVYGRDDTMRRMAAYAEQAASDQDILRIWTDRQEMSYTFSKRNHRTVKSLKESIKHA